MIWHRVLTAIVLIALVLAAILLTNVLTFTLLSSGLFVLGFWEWTGLCGDHSVEIKILASVLFALGLGSLWLVPPAYYAYLYILSFLVWIILMFWTLSYKGVFPLLLKNTYTRWGIGYLVLALAWFGLLQIRLGEKGSLWILFLLLIVCTSDTAAYFTGKALGKRPFSPLISPKKTWAGFWGGMVGAFVVAMVCFWQMGLPQSQWPYFAIMAFILILLAIYGDLFESLVKRVANKKDSGSILPGHGGILDRLDSLLPTLPFFAGYLFWIK